MADFNDVATNTEILRIAEAIRAATRTSEGMTIPEMPDRLMDIRVVEYRDVTVELNTEGEVLLGVFDQELKHLFVATPYADQDNDAVNAASVQRALIFDQETGSLYLHEEIKTDLTARFIVIDFLLASDQTSGGVLMKGPDYVRGAMLGTVPIQVIGKMLQLPEYPSKVSELQNDSHFVTEQQVGQAESSAVATAVATANQYTDTAFQVTDVEIEEEGA